MIYGKRNYVRGLELRLAVGYVIDESPHIIGGPVASVKKFTEYYVEIVPGDIKSGKLAKTIIEKLKPKTPLKYRSKLQALNLDEIQAFIPAGKGSTVK